MRVSTTRPAPECKRFHFDEGWADFICKLEADPTDEALKKINMRTKATGLIARAHCVLAIAGQEPVADHTGDRQGQRL